MRWVKTMGGTLAPFDEAAVRWLDRVDTAEPVSLEAVDEDGSRFRAYVFACIRDVATTIRMKPEDLRASLLMETGRFSTVGDLFGKPVVALHSMSRLHMSDIELRSFWGEASNIIKFKLLCHVKDIAERERLMARLMPSKEEIDA